MRASEKTGLSPALLENLVDEIEMELQQRSVREVASQEIGELVLSHLRCLNEVAYIRFASVYRQFQGIHDFVDTLNQLQTDVPESHRSHSFVPAGSEDEQPEPSQPALNSLTS